MVLAAPFSSLRANVDLSKAGLSALKLQAINNLGMANHGKVILQFNGHPRYANGFDGNMLADSPTNWMWEESFQAGNNTAPSGILLQYPSGSTTTGYVTRYGLTAHEGVAPVGLVNEVLAPSTPSTGRECARRTTAGRGSTSVATTRGCSAATPTGASGR